MSTEIKRRYSLEEYLELERTSEEKYEYFNGEVFGMSGVSPNHAQIEINLITLLNNRLRERGCRVYPANVRVKVPSLPPYRYPDVSVLCDKPVYEEIGGVEALTNPTLIIEVLSSTTEAFDRGDKFSHYKSIPSFREYLLVAQHRLYITHYVKTTNKKWEQEEATEVAASLHLPTIDCTLALSEVYRDVEFSRDLR